jgi:GNAT superfamily N-acetyltransferase
LISVRAITEDDRAAVVELALPFCLAEPWAELLADVDHAAAIHRRLDFVFSLGDRGVCLVAVEGEAPGRLPGPGRRRARPDGLADGRRDRLWVLPERRATSAAHQLLRCASDWAHSRGVKTLRMFAPMGSRLGTLYERNGYLALETAYLKRLA